MALHKHTLFARLKMVATPFFRSEARRFAYFLLAALIGLLLTINYVNYSNSFVVGRFMTALEQKQQSEFYSLAQVLALCFALATLIEVTARFTEQRLALLWRDWLTRTFLDRYLGNHSYLRLTDRSDVDNPDQRISEDVKTFTASSISFLVLTFNGCLTLYWFSSILWSITPWLFAVAIAYATTASVGAILLGRRLVPLDNRQLRTEADFRYGLGRLREHARAVAAEGREAEERGGLLTRLGALITNFRSVIALSRNISYFTTFYNYLPQIIPFAVVASVYFRGGIEWGKVAQAAIAFTQVQGAFSLIVIRFLDVAAYVAVIGRLAALWEATEGPEEAAPPGPVGGPPALPVAEPEPAFAVGD